MEWKISTELIPYAAALSEMEARQYAVQKGNADELIWLLEHPPVYTAGRSAKPIDLINKHGFELYEVGRGGQYTYHGPGQRVVYLVLDLGKHGKDVRSYVKQLEQWVIDTLSQFGLIGSIREGRVGVWVEKGHSEEKIAALGVRIQKWVTTHGIAINLNPNLSHYAGIVPCGISEFGVTSMHASGYDVSMSALDEALKATCPFIV